MRGVEKMKHDTIGVDVSKDHLDAHRLADGATRRFANTKGCLSFGALPRVSVQAKGKDEGDQTLARPVKRSAYSRSDPRR